MALKTIVQTLAGSILCVAGLFADTPLQTINQELLIDEFYRSNGYPTQDMFGFPGDWEQISTKHAIANLRKYKIKFNDQELPTGTGFIDSNAGYLTYGETKLITNPKQIRYILDHFELLPASFGTFNMNAYVGTFKHGSTKKIIFVEHANRYALENGVVVDTFFNNLTFIASDIIIHDTWAKYLFHKAKHVHSFLQGNPDALKVIRVFGTPNDQFTNQFYNEILPFVDSGEVAIHWSLFSVNHHYDSRGKIFAIYEGVIPEGAPYPPTPAGAWAYNNDFFNPSFNEGGIFPIVKPHHDTVCHTNQALAYSVQYVLQPPFILFKDTSGKYEYVIGVPPDITAFVNSIYVE